MDTIFLPDTLFDMTFLNHGTFIWGSDPKSGMQADYQNNWNNFAIYFHLCGSVCIDFYDDARTTAHGKSKTINPICMRNTTGGIEVVIASGVYFDTLVKTGSNYGGWRIKTRKWVAALHINNLNYVGGSGKTLSLFHKNN